MPFGLCNAPATFQRLMDSVLAGLHWKTCLVYIDDIIVVGKSFDEHLCNLQAVFERLRQAGLKLHPRKCHLLQLKALLQTQIRQIESISGQFLNQPKKYRTRTKFRGLNFRVAIRKYIRGSIFSWCVNFRGCTPNFVLKDSIRYYACNCIL